MTPEERIERAASMLWTFDGGEPVPKAEQAATRDAYRNRARVLANILNDKEDKP